MTEEGFSFNLAPVIPDSAGGEGGGSPELIKCYSRIRFDSKVTIGLPVKEHKGIHIPSHGMELVLAS